MKTQTNPTPNTDPVSKKPKAEMPPARKIRRGWERAMNARPTEEGDWWDEMEDFRLLHSR